MVATSCFSSATSCGTLRRLGAGGAPTSLEDRLNQLVAQSLAEVACEGRENTQEECQSLGCCCYGQWCEDAGISTTPDEMCRSNPFFGRPTTWPCENYRGE